MIWKRKVNWFQIIIVTMRIPRKQFFLLRQLPYKECRDRHSLVKNLTICHMPTNILFTGNRRFRLVSLYFLQKTDLTKKIRHAIATNIINNNNVQLGGKIKKKTQQNTLISRASSLLSRILFKNPKIWKVKFYHLSRFFI